MTPLVPAHPTQAPPRSRITGWSALTRPPSLGRSSIGRFGSVTTRTGSRFETTVTSVMRAPEDVRLVRATHDGIRPPPSPSGPSRRPGWGKLPTADTGYSASVAASALGDRREHALHAGPHLGRERSERRVVGDAELDHRIERLHDRLAPVVLPDDDVAR